MGCRLAINHILARIQSGAVLATDLNVGAFEGGLTVFSSQPMAAAVMAVEPNALSLSGWPGEILQTTLTPGKPVTELAFRVLASLPRT